MERLRELRTSEWKSRRWNWAKISESRDYLTLVILKVSVEANCSHQSLCCLKRPTILSKETYVLRQTVLKSHYTQSYTYGNFTRTLTFEDADALEALF